MKRYRIPILATLASVCAFFGGMGVQVLVQRSDQANPCYPAQVKDSYWDDATPTAWRTQLRDHQCSDGRVVFVRTP